MPADYITGPGPAELKALALKLRAQSDGKAKKMLRDRLKEAARPVADDVRASALAMPARKYPDRGLRAEIAATVSVSVAITRTGVRMNVISSGRKMPEGKRNLNAYTDRPQGWSHPVFAQGPRFHMGRSHARRYAHRPRFLVPMVHIGNWTWVKQVEAPRWFERGASGAAADANEAGRRALEDIKRDLE